MIYDLFFLCDMLKIKNHDSLLAILIFPFQIILKTEKQEAEHHGDDFNRNSKPACSLSLRMQILLVAIV